MVFRSRIAWSRDSSVEDSCVKRRGSQRPTLFNQLMAFASYVEAAYIHHSRARGRAFFPPTIWSHCDNSGVRWNCQWLFRAGSPWARTAVWSISAGIPARKVDQLWSTEGLRKSQDFWFKGVTLRSAVGSHGDNTPSERRSETEMDLQAALEAGLVSPNGVSPFPREAILTSIEVSRGKVLIARISASIFTRKT